jgi:oxygen-independent coproporphyrinogen III oxidase
MNYSLYIHIPFCTHRCAYCDFNTYAGQEAAIPAYVEALRREIELVGAAAPERITLHTVFFGGGTPSLLSAGQFRSILDSIRRSFDLGGEAEITTEANPGTVSYRALAELRSIGINRISFGAQSANGEELKMLERSHTFLDVIEAVSSARRAGFDNLNLDLIYGLPEQSLETWKTTARRVLDLEPEHISAYALTLEHGTPFGRWAARGMLPIPDGDVAADMYNWASDAFEQAGYAQYEISNWGMKRSAGSSRLSAVREEPEFACKHNLQYWRCLPYLGIGAGAHGYVGGYRYSNVLRIKTYMERMAGDDGRVAHLAFPLSPAAVNQHRQTVQDDMSEFMITGLRLTREGISPSDFANRFGKRLVDIYAKQILRLTASGLLEWGESYRSGGSSESLHLTRRGRLLGNQAFLQFV